MNLVAVIGEIVSKAFTIASSQGGLEWLLNHVRQNAEFQTRLDAAVAEMKDAPPPKMAP